MSDKEFGEAWADLYSASFRALQKMLAVYHDLHPDAPEWECWAEGEALAEAIKRVHEVTGYEVVA